MAYKLLQLPVEAMASASEEGRAEYARWFRESLNSRIACLEEAVGQGWTADFEPESLTPLGTWFASVVKSVERTEDEIAKMQARLAPHIKVPKMRPSDKSASLAYDIAMYFGETLRRQDERLDWVLGAHPTGQMLVTTPTLPMARPCDPVGLMLVWTFGMVAGKLDGSRLHQLFEIWSRLVTEIVHSSRKTEPASGGPCCSGKLPSDQLDSRDVASTASIRVRDHHS